MGILLGLGVAVTYGGADFIGGFTAKHSATGAVVFFGQAAGLLAALMFAVALGGDPEPRDLTLGMSAGVVGIVGVTALYRGLAVGRMGVVAPITAVVNAMIPLGWGLAQGERPSGLAYVGVAMALFAVVLIAYEPDVEDDSPAAASRTTQVLLGLAAGVGFGIALVCFAETSSDSGVWPGFAARCTTVPLLALVLLIGRRVLLPHRGDRRLVAVGGVLDAGANAFQLLAVREGLLALVAPVSALYPAGTVLLARLVLHERIGRARLLGLAVALAGLVLIAV
ncbi:MAG: EamA family transporter [Acidimicrobiia bacterium]